MRFCTYEECPHYSKATKYDRACYYGEPQCWKGWVDLIIMTIGLRFSRKPRGRKGDDAY